MQLSLGALTARYLFGWDDYAGRTTQESVETFLNLNDSVAARWIESPKGVMLLQMVPGDPTSGAIYVLDRKLQYWSMLCFDEAEDDQFTAEKFDRAFSEYDLFRYVEQPLLLLDRLDVAQA
ncbi:MAG: hypothetical protein WDN23_05375 [Edaphobacter sp.]